MRITAVLLAGLLLIGAGCSGSSSATTDESLPEPQELTSSGFADGAYELEVSTLGGVLRRSVIEAPAVGTESLIEVRIEGDDGIVGARLAMTIDSSWADGSTLSANFVLTEVDAADPTLAEALEAGLGSSLWVQRDEVAMISDYVLGLTDEDELDPTAAFWISRMLEAPTTFAGPIPHVALGEGAAWTVTLQGSDGTQLIEERELVGLDSDRFIINGVSEDAEQTVVIEGEIGNPIADRQVITTSDYTITVTVLN